MGETSLRSKSIILLAAASLLLGQPMLRAHEPGEERAEPLEHHNHVKLDEWIDCLEERFNPSNCGDPDGWTVEEVADLLSAFPNVYLWMGNNSRRPAGSEAYVGLAPHVNALQVLLRERGVDPKRIMVDFRPEVYGKSDGFPWAGDMDGSKGDPPFDTDWIMRVSNHVYEQVVLLWENDGSAWPDPFDPPGGWPPTMDEEAILALNTPEEKVAGYGVATPQNGMRISSVIVNLADPAYRAWRARYLLYKIEDYGLTPGEPFSVLLSYKPGVHTWWGEGDLNDPQRQTNYLETLPDGTPTWSYGIQLPLSYGGLRSARNIFPTQYGPGEYEQAVSDFVRELTEAIHAAGYEDFDILLHDSAVLAEPWRILDERTRKNLHVQGDVAVSFKPEGERARPHAAPLNLRVDAVGPDHVDLAWDPPIGPAAAFTWMDSTFEDDPVSGGDDDPAGFSVFEDADETIAVVAGSSTGGRGANAQIVRLRTPADAWFGMSVSLGPVWLDADRALQIVHQRVKIRVDDASLPTHVRPVRMVGRNGAEQVFTLALQPAVTTGEQAGFYVADLATGGPFTDLADVPVVPEIREGDWYQLDVRLNLFDKSVEVSVENLDDPDPAQRGTVTGHMGMDYASIRTVLCSTTQANANAEAAFSLDDWQTMVTDEARSYRVVRDGEVVGSVPFDQLAYRDEAVTPNADYTYRVRVGGQLNAGALPSNEVAATTEPGPEVCTDAIDNDADGAVDCDDGDCRIDADGDGVLLAPCGTDCDDSNGEVAFPPGPVGSLRWEDRETLAWTDPGFGAGGATAYQLLRGVVSALPVGSGVQEVCLDPAVEALAARDPTGIPSGDVFYYLVRGTNVCAPVEGVSYGTRADGTERRSRACP